MSYARWENGSNVYIIGTDRGLECVLCRLLPEFVTRSRSAMLEHLKLHRQSGDGVPSCADVKLMSEIVMEGDMYTVNPVRDSQTMADAHCASCAQCQAYRETADDAAKQHGERAAALSEELLWIVSYLAYYDQDANHAWMVRRICAVLAGKDPSGVVGWTEMDGVRQAVKGVGDG